MGHQRVTLLAGRHDQPGRAQRIAQDLLQGMNVGPQRLVVACAVGPGPGTERRRVDRLAVALGQRQQNDGLLSGEGPRPARAGNAPLPRLHQPVVEPKTQVEFVDAHCS